MKCGSMVINNLGRKVQHWSYDTVPIIKGDTVRSAQNNINSMELSFLALLLMFVKLFGF